MAARVNGAIRRTVRQAVSVAAGHRPPRVAGGARRRRAAGRERLPVQPRRRRRGPAVAADPVRRRRAAAALVVARYSVPAAVAAFVFIAWQRSLLRRHYAEAIATGMTGTTGDGRRRRATGPRSSARRWAPRSCACSGSGPGRSTASTPTGSGPVDELSRVLLGAHRLHWTVFALNALAAVVPFLLLARLGRRRQLDAGRAHRRARRRGRRRAGARRRWGGRPSRSRRRCPSSPRSSGSQRFHAEERPRPPTAASPTTAGDRCPIIRFERRLVRATRAPTAPVLARPRPRARARAVGRDRRRERRRQDHAAQAARPASTSRPRAASSSTARPRATSTRRAWRRRLAVIFQEFMRFELSAFENVALADPDHPDAARRTPRPRHARPAPTRSSPGCPKGWDTDPVARLHRRRRPVGRPVAAHRPRPGPLRRPGRRPGADPRRADGQPRRRRPRWRCSTSSSTHAAGCTAMVVSHRFSTVRRADRIVVLADGRVVEDGRHAELHGRRRPLRPPLRPAGRALPRRRADGDRPSTTAEVVTRPPIAGPPADAPARRAAVAGRPPGRPKLGALIVVTLVLSAARRRHAERRASSGSSTPPSTSAGRRRSSPRWSAASAPGCSARPAGR